jgi:hypothetical protein
VGAVQPCCTLEVQLTPFNAKCHLLSQAALLHVLLLALVGTAVYIITEYTHTCARNAVVGRAGSAQRTVQAYSYFTAAIKLLVCNTLQRYCSRGSVLR